MFILNEVMLGYLKDSIFRNCYKGDNMFKFSCCNTLEIQVTNYTTNYLRERERVCVCLCLHMHACFVICAKFFNIKVVRTLNFLALESGHFLVQM